MVINGKREKTPPGTHGRRYSAEELAALKAKLQSCFDQGMSRSKAVAHCHTSSKMLADYLAPTRDALVANAGRGHRRSRSYEANMSRASELTPSMSIYGRKPW